MLQPTDGETTADITVAYHRYKLQLLPAASSPQTTERTAVPGQ